MKAHLSTAFLARVLVVVAAVCALVSDSPTAFAQEALTLDRVRALARERSPAVLAAAARVGTARANRAEAAVPLRPSVRLSGIGEVNDREITIDLPVSVPGLEPPLVQPRQQVLADLSVSAPIFDADALARRVAADEGVRADAFRAEAAARRAEAAAVQLAFGVGAADRAVDALETLVVLRERFAEEVTLRAAAGDATELDARRAEVALASARFDLSEANERRGRAARALGELLGGIEVTAVDVSGDAPPAPVLEDQLPVDRRDEVLAARAATSQADALRRSSARALVPDLLATGSAGVSTSPAIDGEHWRAQGRLVLSFDVYARGSREATRQRADALAAAAAAERDASVAAAIREIGDARAAVEASESAFEFARDRLALARDVLRLAEAAWDEGAASALEVQEAQTDLALAELEAIDAERAATAAEWQLWYALGGR